jgi:hypothetical protein
MNLKQINAAPLQASEAVVQRLGEDIVFRKRAGRELGGDQNILTLRELSYPPFGRARAVHFGRINQIDTRRKANFKGTNLLGGAM